MHYAVHYRLHPDQTERDRNLLDGVYRELAALRPDWLTCESFRLDDRGSAVLYIDVADIEWLEQTPRLSWYLEDLAERCEIPPRTGTVDRSAVDVTDATEVGAWDPAGGTWRLPLDARPDRER